MLQCQCPSICPSVVTEVHWRIIANLGSKFRSKFTTHYARSPQCAATHCMPGRGEGSSRAMLATAMPSCFVTGIMKNETPMP